MNMSAICAALKAPPRWAARTRYDGCTSPSQPTRASSSTHPWASCGTLPMDPGEIAFCCPGTVREDAWQRPRRHARNAHRPQPPGVPATAPDALTEAPAAAGADAGTATGRGASAASDSQQPQQVPRMQMAGQPRPQTTGAREENEAREAGRQARPGSRSRSVTPPAAVPATGPAPVDTAAVGPAAAQQAQTPTSPRYQQQQQE
jgi:hypothetical protein